MTDVHTLVTLHPSLFCLFRSLYVAFMYIACEWNQGACTWNVHWMCMFRTLGTRTVLHEIPHTMQAIHTQYILLPIQQLKCWRYLPEEARAPWARHTGGLTSTTPTARMPKANGCPTHSWRKWSPPEFQGSPMIISAVRLETWKDAWKESKGCCCTRAQVKIQDVPKEGWIDLRGNSTGGVLFATIRFMTKLHDPITKLCKKDVGEIRNQKTRQRQEQQLHIPYHLRNCPSVEFQRWFTVCGNDTNEVNPWMKTLTHCKRY